MNRKIVDGRIDKKEIKALADLRTIVDDITENCTVTGTYHGCHYDAIITTPLQNFEYVELKRRNVEWEAYPDAIALKKTKAEALQKIQKDEGVKVVVIWMYPKSDAYMVKTLDEVVKHNDVRLAYVKKTEMDDDSEKELQPHYYYPLKDEDRRFYVSTVSF